MDPQQEKQLLQWYEELEREDANILPALDDSEGSEVDEVEIQENHTDLEDEVSEAPEHTVTTTSRSSRVPVYVGKDKTTIWRVHCPINSKKTPACNKVTTGAGVKGVAKQAKTIVDCWHLFFPIEILSTIVLYTNISPHFE